MGREFFSSRENNTYNHIYFYLLETSSKNQTKKQNDTKIQMACTMARLEITQKTHGASDVPFIGVSGIPRHCSTTGAHPRLVLHLLFDWTPATQ